MEADPRFVFTLDGQLATVDDYLEVRPEAEERIRALVQAGRLVIGPWYVLMDEYLVSGESILRNLELGLRRAEELGGAMPVGYLPDQFGHVAQMPQILRRAGLEHAAVWRGVPAAVDRHVFRWVAPDGSSVRAEYLPRGYGNAANVLDVPERLGAKVQLLEEAMRPFFGDDDVLAMYGTDHTEPASNLVEAVERTNATQGGVRIVLHTLADYFGQVRGSDPGTWPEWTGELRSGARANLLPGVASARIDLKAACARAERLLERYAEPLEALWGESWPDSLLALAWRRVIENSAHDSICGCSADEVCRQVLVRFDEAEQIAAGLVAEALAGVAADAPQGATAVVNPSPHARSDLVELDLEIPDEWDDVALVLPDGRLLATQELARAEPFLLERELAGHEIAGFLDRRLHGRELFGRQLNGLSLERQDRRRLATFEVGDDPDPVWLDVDELRGQLELAIQPAPDERWLVRILARPRRTVAALVPAPALGWTSVRPTSGRGTVEAPVRAEGLHLSNGLLEVEAAPDGTLTLGGLRGVARIVDGGDFGDSYNYAPPETDSLVDQPESVDVEVVSPGPLRGELAVARTYSWPLGVEPDGSARTEEAARVEVMTRVELRAGEPFARLRVSFDNRCRDHRVRFHIPLAHPATGSAAEGQFAVVERGLEVEGGYGETPIATYPARGFVDAGPVAVLLEHVLEYEVVDGRELALTLLRSIGLISRNENPWREDPAGPQLAIPEAQLVGPRVVSFAVFPHADTWAADGVLRQMERYQHPFLTAPGTGANGAAQERPGLELTGDGVVLSSLRRREGNLEVTLACEEPSSRTVTLNGANVPGGELSLKLGAWEIRTIPLQ